MTITDLVSKYDTNRSTYIDRRYNETQLRTDFLDPFFQILGWDITNTSGKTTHEREVLLEESLKADTTSNSKKPDYTFRLFSERKFFLEAKKPYVRIEENPDPAKQVRRYGFTAKLKISVLSNFEYLAIYDCSGIVKENDTSQTARIALFHYTEYEEKIDEIHRLLSKESVYSGEFENTWNEIETKLQKTSIDDVFLEQINSWRLILGEEIYRNDKTIDERALDDTVQAYLNSLLFLRVCEDRDLEDYKTLLEYSNNNNYTALIEKIKASDKKYNAKLFSLNMVESIISNNSSAFWTIINQLYFPESCYSFSVLGSDLLGNIYEVFLSEHLRIKDNKIILEKKLENIDRDIVTTPSFIIKDILRNTLLAYSEEKTAEQLLEIKIGDIACGSGAFLLETFQLLSDILIDKYLNEDKSKLIQTNINTFKLSYETKKHILENCIYGNDKDYNAVEACKFGLLLKLLEEENNKTITIPALPNIDNQIIYGNSLIDSSMINGKVDLEINPYDFDDFKFDIIVGNPPYLATEHMKRFTPTEYPIYKNTYSVAYKQFDKYYLFIERAINLIKDNGFLGYIIPNKFTKVGAALKLRELLKDNKYISQIISFGANQVFRDKSTYTCIIIVNKKDQKELKYTEISNLKNWQTRNIDDDIFDTLSINSLENDNWILIPKKFKDTYSKIITQSTTLKDLIGELNISNGIQTSANRVYIHKIDKEDHSFIYFTKDSKQWKIEKELTRPYYTTGTGIHSLNTYRELVPNSFVIYPYVINNEKVEFVEIETMKNKYPHLLEFLLEYKDKLDNKRRDIQPPPATSNEWYRYGRHQSLETCDVDSKIVVGVLSQGNKYAIDTQRTLISSGGTAGYCMITIPKDSNYSIYYIQAILNSKYIEWISSLYGEVFRGGYIARGTKVLKKLPIRTIDFSKIEEKDFHDKIVATQKELIKCQSNIDQNQNIERNKIIYIRSFENKKKELDLLLQNLYQLEDDNIVPLISEIYETN